MAQITDYVFLALAVYCIIRGIITLVTGNIPAGESAHIKAFSESGITRYRIISGVLSITGGIFICALFALRMFSFIGKNIYTIAGIGGCILLVIIFLAARRSCSKVGLTA